MRVNLISQALSPSAFGSASSSPSKSETFPISLTIRPACGLPGEYNFPTDSAALLRMLRQQTDLPSTVLERFQLSLSVTRNARLLGVELSDRVLTSIGYFVD